MPDVIGGRFEPSRLLGAGSFGYTYAARDRETDQEVAVKLLSIERLTDWKALELFEREAKVLKGLDHPQIPDYVDYACGEGKGESYLAQQLAPGRSLQDLLDVGEQFDEELCVEIARQALDVLVYLEGRKPPVVHRDIKPENLLWDGQTLYVVDFGAVRQIIDEMSVGSTVAGTFGYMAPEQMRGQAMPATDLYGLGMTLVHLLTGVAPERLPQRGMRPDYRRRIDLSPALAQILDEMIEPDVEKRIESATKCLEHFQQLDAVHRVDLDIAPSNRLEARLTKAEQFQQDLRRSEEIREQRRWHSILDKAGHHLQIEALGKGRWVVEFSPTTQRPFLTRQDLSRGLLLYTGGAFVATVPLVAIIGLIFNWHIGGVIFVGILVMPLAIIGGWSLLKYKKLIDKRLGRLVIEDNAFALNADGPQSPELLGRTSRLSVRLSSGQRGSFGKATFSYGREERTFRNMTPTEVKDLERFLRRVGVNIRSS